MGSQNQFTLNEDIALHMDKVGNSLLFKTTRQDSKRNFRKYYWTIFYQNYVPQHKILREWRLVCFTPLNGNTFISQLYFVEI